MGNAQELKKWSKDNSKFLSLKDGESFVGTFKDFRSVIQDYKGEERSVVKYQIADESGDIKVWSNGSTSVADRMAEFLGKKIKVTRSGEGSNTKYDIKSINGSIKETNEEEDWEKS